MTRVRFILPTLLCIALTMGGCQSVAEVQPVLTVSSAQYRGAFDSAVTTLRDLGYDIDREDYRFGVITTHPRYSPIVAEVWDRSNTTFHQMIDSTLNHQRRIVRVTIAASLIDDVSAAPASDTGDRELRVEVTIQRMQNPARQMSGTKRGRRVLQAMRRPAGELVEKGVTRRYWLDVGHDPQLAGRLYGAIQKRVAAGVDQSPTDAAESAGPVDAAEPTDDVVQDRMDTTGSAAASHTPNNLTDHQDPSAIASR